MRAQETADDSPAADVYAAALLDVMPRLLSMLCRDRTQPESLGCFDREHWAWKMRDVPEPTVQRASEILALVYANAFPGNPYAGRPQIRDWTIEALRYTVSIQGSSGAWDQVYPNERSVAATAFVLNGIVGTADALGDLDADFLLPCVTSAADFLSAAEETHGYVANHRAAWARALDGACRLAGESRWAARALELVEDLATNQADDGFFPEYGGCDLGYGSLCAAELAKLATGKSAAAKRAAEIVRPCVEFLSWALAPDGTFSADLSWRGTALVYPGGFERLAGESNPASDGARRLRASFGGRGIALRALDATNLVPLALDYLGSYLAARRSTPVEPKVADRSDVAEDAGLLIVRRGPWSVRASSATGAVDVYHGPTLAAREAGYLMVDEAGRLHSTGTRFADGSFAREGDQIRHSRHVRPVRSESISAWQGLALRLFGLTAARVEALNERFKQMAADRLGPGGEDAESAGMLERHIELADDAIRIVDTFSGAWESVAPAGPSGLAPFHMASARYYEPAAVELDSPGPLTDAEISNGREIRIERS